MSAAERVTAWKERLTNLGYEVHTCNEWHLQVTIPTGKVDIWPSKEKFRTPQGDTVVSWMNLANYLSNFPPEPTLVCVTLDSLRRLITATHGVLLSGQNVELVPHVNLMAMLAREDKEYDRNNVVMWNG